MPAKKAAVPHRPVRLHWQDRPTAPPRPQPRELVPLLRFRGQSQDVGRARLVSGDALAAMDRLVQEGARFDLVHLDPPFGSEAKYERRRSIRTAAGQRQVPTPAYGDRDGGDVAAYLELLYPLLCRAHALLKPTGSLYLHIDFRRGPHLRLLLDEIFGADALLNEIVWAYALGGSAKGRYQRKHDTIYFYAREPGQHYFQAPREAATSSMLKGQPKRATDTWLTESADDAASIERDWPDELVRKTLSNRDPERTGYGTQKPLALAARIVAASCPPGGVVLDPMCGSGTIGVAAVSLGRQAVLNDRGAAALDVTRSRLLKAGAELAIDRVSGGPLPNLVKDRSVVTARGDSAVLGGAGGLLLTSDVLRDLAETEPLAAVGAWGVGRLHADGALLIDAVHDHAHLRDAGPAPAQLPRSGATHWWLADVTGRQFWGSIG